MDKTIEVIIPAKGAQEWLPRCIASIEKQTTTGLKVTIGVDACPDTLETARNLQQQTSLNLSIYNFPDHAGQCRVRNTLAVRSRSDILVFFDADDEMHADYVEMMTKSLHRDNFAQPRCWLVEDGDARSWNHAHGLTAIYRDTWIQMCGQHDWPAGADTEALYRFMSAGLTFIQPKLIVATIYKHGSGLTSQKRLQRGSSYYRHIRRVICKRRIKPVRIDDIATAPCHLVDDQTDVQLTNNLLSMRSVADANNADATGAVEHLRQMLLHTTNTIKHTKGRKVQKRASEWLKQYDKREIQT